MKPMVQLSKFKKGDKAAILSPSFAAPGRFHHVYELGLKCLREIFELEPVVFPATVKLGASGEEHAADLVVAFKDPDIKGIITSIGGYVEIDEMFIGSTSEATKRGRGTDKTPVLVAVSYVPINEKDEVTGFAKLRAVAAINEKTVADFIRAEVDLGATIRTDGLSVYPTMEKYGYTHDREPVRKRKAHLVFPHVHMFISNLRSFVQGTHHGLAEDHLQQYLDEFCYRFNRRHRRGEMFDRLLRACLEQEEVPHSALTA